MGSPKANAAGHGGQFPPSTPNGTRRRASDLSQGVPHNPACSGRASSIRGRTQQVPVCGCPLTPQQHHLGSGRERYTILRRPPPLCLVRADRRDLGPRSLRCSKSMIANISPTVDGEGRDGGRFNSRKNYRGSTCGTTALPMRAPIASNSWRYIGSRWLRVTKRSRIKVKAVSSYKGEGRRTPKNANLLRSGSRWLCWRIVGQPCTHTHCVRPRRLDARLLHAGSVQ